MIKRQTAPGKRHPLVKRFVATIGIAVAWSTVSLAGLSLGWVLFGAACIGILATVGAEPPRRSQVRLGSKPRPASNPV